MLNSDTNTKLSKTTKFQLHNPINKSETIALEIKANSICYFEGRVLYCGFETPLSFVTTNNSKLDIEKMKSKSYVCTFGLSIGLTLDKRNSLNNLKATIYNHLEKTKKYYYKNKLDKNMLQYLMSNQCLNSKLFTFVVMVQLLLPAQPLVKFWE